MTEGCEHDWLDVEEDSVLTTEGPFRFCTRCDRSEWANGVVREPAYDQ